MTISELLDRISIELTDVGRVSWSVGDLVSYYNSAIAAIANYRPDLFAVTRAISCQAGTRQALPAGAITLLEVERNTGGRRTRYFDRGDLDDLDPDWMMGEGATEAEAYLYESSNPKVFWLYPGVQAGASVDVVMSELPEPVTVSDVEGGAPMQVEDTYATACMDWIISRAYLRDADNTVNSARGQLHLQSFSQYLGIKIQSDGAIFSGREQKFQANKG